MNVDELAASFSQATGAVVHGVHQLHGGELNVTAVVATTTGSFVVRSPRHRETWLATVPGQAAGMQLARRAGLPVPEVVYADHELLAYRFVEGETLTEQHAVDGLAEKAGELLARMHAIRGDGCGPVQADGSSPGWASDAYFNGVPDEIARLLSDFDATWGIQRADLEAAAGLLDAPPPFQSVLVHGDIGIGNIIVRDGEIAAIIDFDCVWFGDPAIDLAWWWWRSPITADAFARACATAGDRVEPITMWACRVRLLLGLAAIFAARMPTRAAHIGSLLTIAIAELVRLQ